MYKLLFLLLVTTSIVSATSYSQSVLDNNPLHYYRLGETSGTVAEDSAGNVDASYTAGGGFISPNLGVTGALSGDGNTGVEITGPNSLVSVPTQSLVLSEYTLEI